MTATADSNGAGRVETTEDRRTRRTRATSRRRTALDSLAEATDQAAVARSDAVYSSPMGGTALSVLTPYTGERVEPILVEEMTAEGLTRYEPDPNFWYSADGLPYGHDIQRPDSEIDPEELQLVERTTGVMMRCDILLHIFVSDLAGRPALARMAQHVARRTEGWVFVEFYDPPSLELLDHLVGAGRCIRVDDAVYLDAAAMTAWIAHPDFHVVK